MYIYLYSRCTTQYITAHQRQCHAQWSSHDRYKKIKIKTKNEIFLKHLAQYHYNLIQINENICI